MSDRRRRRSRFPNGMRTHDAGIGLSMGYPFVTGCRASSRPQYGRIRWILQARRTANGWSEPTVAPFSGRWDDCDPWISSDGSQLYFLSKRPLTEGGPPKRDLDIWVMAKVPNGRWGRHATSATRRTVGISSEGFAALAMGWEAVPRAVGAHSRECRHQSGRALNKSRRAISARLSVQCPSEGGRCTPTGRRRVPAP